MGAAADALLPSEQLPSDSDGVLPSDSDSQLKLDPYQQQFLQTGLVSPDRQSFADFQAQHPTDTQEAVQRLIPLAKTPEQQEQLGRFIAERMAPEQETPGLGGQIWETAWSAPKSTTEYVRTMQGIRDSEADATTKMRAMARAHGVDPDKFAPLPSLTSRLAEGTFDAVEDLALTFQSPGGVLTLGMGGLPKATQRFASLAFAGQMLSQVPDQAQQLLQEIRKPAEERDYRKIAQLAVGGAASLGFGITAGLHGAGAFEPKPEVQGPMATGAVLQTPAGAERPDVVAAAEPLGPPPATSLAAFPEARAMSAEPAGPPGPAAPEVPATPAEPRESSVDEIRRNNATTIAQIQALFPKAQLNRERARELRNLAWGPPAPVETSGPAAEEAPVPVRPESVQAQGAAALDPDHPRAAVLQVAGEPAPEAEGLQPVATAQGTAWINPDKVSPEQAKLQFDQPNGGGRLLGMASETRPANPTAVVTTRDAKGVPVTDEAVTPETLPAAVEQAQKNLPIGGRVEVRSPDAVIQERQAAEPAAKPTTPESEVANAPQTRNEPGNAGPEHQGIPSRPDVPANTGQVRAGGGQPAGGGRGGVHAAQEPAGPVAGRVEASGTSAPRPRPAPTQIQPPPAVATTPAPAVHPLRQWLAQRVLGFKSIFAPHTIDSGAKQVADILREYGGEKANNLARVEQAMHAWRADFDRTPVPSGWTHDPNQPLPHNFQVIDAMERNRAALPQRYRDLADLFDKEFAWRIEAIRKFAPNALQHLIENYFPHIWDDPKRAAGVMQQVANRLFAGRKEFLKQRSLPFFAEGLARGLKPISDNPVDLLLAKMLSMDKFIMALKALDEFKATGKMRFKYAYEKMPDGWQKFDDPAFIVNAPPMVTLKEAFDAQLRTRTLELLDRLGVPHSRLASLGGKRWGLAYESPEQIKTRFGGPMSVYWHELGHVLDYRYDLQKDFLHQGSKFNDQLRALADQRAGNQPVTQSFRDYLHKGSEKMAVMLEAYTHAPNLFRQVAPDVYAKFDQFIEDHPDLHGIRDLVPSLELGTDEMEQKLPGVLKLGDWIMPDGPAQVVKNYLSPGLQSSGVYRLVRAASNLLNAAQLGLSGFHVGFTSLDAVVNAAEVGLYRALHGDIAGGAKTLARAPLAPVLNYYTGKAVQAALLDPNVQTIRMLGVKMPISIAAHQYADLAVKAGLRATVDPFWQTHLTRNLIRSIHEGGLAWGKTPLQLPLAAVEQAMRPIAEYLVPRQKLGVFALLAKTEMERLPVNASAEQVRAALARAADATEDRMGQMTYDNLFYNRMAKDLALLAFRAYGWQLGKYRHLIGAAADTAAGVKQIAQGKMPELTHRQLYFVAMPLIVAGIGGMLHYMLTGRRPEDLRDYLHPSTGQIDRNGNEKRLSLPSYLKDLESDQYEITHGYQTGGAAGVAKGAWTATYHRLNPWVSQSVDLINNRDFYGTQIWNPDDPLAKKMLAQAQFLAKGGIPFSIAGTMKLAEGEHSTRDLVLPFIGVVPAKQAISMTPAQLKAAEIVQASASIGGRTQAQAEHARILSQVTSSYRLMNGEDPPPELLSQLRRHDLPTIADRLKYTPLQYQVLKMPLESAMSVWDLANPGERKQLDPMLRQKFTAAAKSGSADPADLMRWSKLVADTAVKNAGPK